MESTPCPEANLECKYFNTERGCHLDEHHKIWPERKYGQPIEQAYRNLDEHTEVICRRDHDAIHADEEPPPKPSHEEMRISVAQAVRMGEMVAGLTRNEKRRLLHLVPVHEPESRPITGELDFQQI